ncbi:MAG: PEP-CTERM sorting domain-containing protein [Burkholderiales bacterium]|nr:PEP-CTERM sorting domain-containing protein [Burkholderiales bacterium]
MHRLAAATHRAAALAATLLATTGALAGPIAADIYGQFSFAGAGSVATGCAPDDPDGSFCFASSGTPTVFLDAPAWTFVAGAEGATLTVIDAFQSGDRFNVFDFGVLLGATSVPASDVDCGDDPVVCLATAGMSVGSFVLGAGAHALTLVVLDAPTASGSGYLQVVAGGASTVPEPASVALLAAALGALLARQRRLS